MLGRDVHGAVEPVEDEVQCAAWHLSSHLARLNVDGGAVLIVAHVEVRRVMVGQIHRDDNPVKVANFWHNYSRFYCFLAANLRKVSDIIILFVGKSAEILQ